MDPTFLVIGIGNTLRRDDGAGWLFAQALADALQDAGAAVELILQHADAGADCSLSEVQVFRSADEASGLDHFQERPRDSDVHTAIFLI